MKSIIGIKNILFMLSKEIGLNDSVQSLRPIYVV